VRRALRAMRGGLVIGAGGALHGVRIVCDARDAIHGMRCNALRCAGRCAARADALRTGCDANALRAGWLYSRGAGGAMLLTEGFLGWVKPKVL
jgi:hypothetical protein